MNIIKQYELKYITLENLSDEIWGYGQQLINEIGIDCFKFYVLISWWILKFWISYIELQWFSLFGINKKDRKTSILFIVL